MPADLTPKLLDAHDSAQFLPGGKVRETTVIRFMLGDHGPFTETFDRNPQRFAIDQAIQARRAQLEGLV